jgi:ribosomal protein L7/L12
MSIASSILPNIMERLHQHKGRQSSEEKAMETNTTRTEKNGAAARDKRTKFVELAQSRTINAIRAIRVIGKLANKSHYDYTDADVKRIVQALNKEVDAVKARLAEKGAKSEVEFQL